MSNLLIERFAWNLVKYTACRLIQCFNTITVDNPGSGAGSDWQELIQYRLDLTMSPDDGVSVILKA